MCDGAFRDIDYTVMRLRVRVDRRANSRVSVSTGFKSSIFSSMLTKSSAISYGA